MNAKIDSASWSKSTTVVKSLYRSMIPIQALAGALPIITTLIDSLMIGKFMGEHGLSTLGFVSPLVLILSAITGVLVSGTQFICGRFLGEGNKAGLKAVFSSSLVLCVLFGSLYAMGCVLFSEELAALLGASGEYLTSVSDYIKGIAFNMLFSLISSCMIIFLQMEKKKTQCSAAVLTMMVINSIGNAVNFLYLKWGMFGAGLFTTAGNMAAVVLELITIMKTSKVFIFSMPSVQGGIIKEIFHIGSPSAVCTLLNALRETIINRYIFSLGGATAISALAVANTVSTFGSIINNGCTGSANAVSGILVGNRDSDTLNKMARLCFRTTAWIKYASYAVIFIFAKQFALLLGAPVENLPVYITFIRLLNLWFITNTLIAVPCSIYQALGQTGLLSVVFSASILLSLSTSILLGKIWGVNAFVSVSWINEVYCLILFFITYYRRSHRFPPSVLDLCYIPTTFSVPEANQYNVSICDVDDAVKASREVMRFCIEKGIPRRNAFIASLCVEEIAVDAAKYRIIHGRNAMDLRIFYENGDISILFRDNCQRFDPNEWLELCTPADEYRSIGIRMVSKIAASMSYSNVMGLNILTINTVFARSEQGSDSPENRR